MRKALNTLIIISFCIFNVFFFFRLFFRINYPIAYGSSFKTASSESGVDVNLLFAIAKTESNFNPTIKSSAGAVGIMQIKEETAKFICEMNNENYEENRLFEPDYNIYLGAKYFKYLLDKFKNTKTALAAYNAGEGNVMKWLNNAGYSKNGVSLDEIPFKETREYVVKVERAMAVYKFFKTELAFVWQVVFFSLHF